MFLNRWVLSQKCVAGLLMGSWTAGKKQSYMQMQKYNQKVVHPVKPYSILAKIYPSLGEKLIFKVHIYLELQNVSIHMMWSVQSLIILRGQVYTLNKKY